MLRASATNDIEPRIPDKPPLRPLERMARPSA